MTEQKKHEIVSKVTITTVNHSGNPEGDIRVCIEIENYIPEIDVGTSIAIAMYKDESFRFRVISALTLLTDANAKPFLESIKDYEQ